jgi:AcrR family transcriptional regulator
MTEYASRGNARLSLTLLWRRSKPRTRGPKPGLTLDDIVAAAIEVADADGLAAVSMRRIGERLGKGTMSLYTYVPGKSELLDLMLDSVLGELPIEPPPAGPAEWRAAAEARARHYWEFYERHPWVLQVSGSRALLGPHELDQYEATLRIFDGLGLSGDDIARAAGALITYVGGAAKAVSDARAAEQATGMSDDEWWNARAPLLDELAADIDWQARFPTTSKLEAERTFEQLDRTEGDTTPYTVWDALRTFEFGLQRLLDGLEAYIGRGARATSGSRRSRRSTGR